MFRTLGNFLVKHSKTTLVSGFLIVALAAWYGTGVFGQLSNSFANFANQQSQSWQARQMLEAEFPGAQKPMLVLFTAKQGQQVKELSTTQEIKHLLNQIPANEAAIESYFTTGAETYI